MWKRRQQLTFHNSAKTQCHHSVTETTAAAQVDAVLYCCWTHTVPTVTAAEVAVGSVPQRGVGKPTAELCEQMVVRQTPNWQLQ